MIFLLLIFYSNLNLVINLNLTFSYYSSNQKIFTTKYTTYLHIDIYNIYSALYIILLTLAHTLIALIRPHMAIIKSITHTINNI